MHKNVNLGSQEPRPAEEKKVNQSERKATEEMIDAVQRETLKLSLETRKTESKRMDYKEKVEIIQDRTQEEKKRSGFDQVDSAAATLDGVNDSGSNRDQTGKLFKVKDIPFSVLSSICMKLNIKDDLSFRDFRQLGEKMGFNKDFTKVLEQKSNPTYELIEQWHSNPKSTVENLIMILKDDDMGRWDVAIILEDWLKKKGIDN